MKFDGNKYLNIVNIASDSNYYDSSKSYSNPRMSIRSSHHLRFDSIFVRGEPHQCAPGNPGPGCPAPSEYNRYTDLVQIGSPASPDKSSWAIEITGATSLINGNHSVIQFFDDGDAVSCESNESGFWVHGTEEEPIRISSKYHHLVSFKGACNILMEYIDFGPAGNGRSDLMQPANSTEQQAGGIIHGSTMRNVVVRFSNFSMGGSATNADRNKSHIEIGMFGDVVDGACFAHNSHFRAWGALANLGRLEGVASVRNASIVNNASQAGWYMSAKNPSAVTSPYEGYLFSRTGLDGLSIDIDGISADTRSARNGLLYGRNGTRINFGSGLVGADGIQFGSAIYGNHSDIFRNPEDWDFRPREGSPLIGSAAPVAVTTSTGSGSIVPVSRPECFSGLLGGLRSGDEVLVGGRSCTVTRTNLSDGTITCSAPISWKAGEELFYTQHGRKIAEIGSRSADVLTGDEGPESKKPKPPHLFDD
jgi:hypothetical protein